MQSFENNKTENHQSYHKKKKLLKNFNPIKNNKTENHQSYHKNFFEFFKIFI